MIRTSNLVFAGGVVGMMWAGYMLPVNSTYPEPPSMNMDVQHPWERLPPCKSEDGPGPCKWLAGEYGNGVGHTFWISCDQRTHYVDQELQELMDPLVNGPGKAYPETC